jgi:hypothetical protein
VEQTTNLQTKIEHLQFEEDCNVITFTLPIIHNQIIDDSKYILIPNETYYIPQCVYFDWVCI